MTIAARLIAKSEELDLYRTPVPALREVAEHFSLRAISFFSYAPDLNLLCLRGQVGLSYEQYESFEISVGLATPSGTVTGPFERIPDIASSPTDENAQVIKHFGLKRAVRLHLTSRVGKNPSFLIGVLHLYLNESDSDIADDQLIEIGAVWSHLYVQAVSEAKLKLREDIMDGAIGAPDLTSFMHKTCHILRDKWDYEASTAYIYDERSKVLQIAATTGVRPRVMLQHRVIRPAERDAVYEAFESATTKTFSASDSIRSEFKFNEETKHAAHAAILIPIQSRVAGSTSWQSLGIMKIVNRLLAHNSHATPVSFAWEDREIFEFLASVLGVIVNMYARRTRVADDLERGLHGMEANLLAAQANINLLLENSAEIRELSGPLRHTLPDCVDQLEALRWQIDRFTRRRSTRRASATEVKLFADVLAKLPPIIRSYGTFYNAQNVQIGRMDDLRHIPTVRGDSEMLLTVFRNLVENAIKYSNRGQSNEISISHEVVGDELVVSVSNNGIGIEERDAPYVFHEGYKADNAMRRQTIGAGLGLYQSKEIMRAIGGDIRLVSFSSPTTFSVHLKLWKQ